MHYKHSNFARSEHKFKRFKYGFGVFTSNLNGIYAINLNT